MNGWQQKEIRCVCGDDRLTFRVVTEGCRVMPDRGFISHVEVVVVAVRSVQSISGTGCAVLAWRYDLRGNSQEGGKQTETAANGATWFTGTWHLQTTAVNLHLSTVRFCRLYLSLVTYGEEGVNRILDFMHYTK